MKGWQGWDDYAPFYDWENAQTMGRRDVKFWQNMARRSKGTCLELGCGTGRVSLPVARTGASVVGIDRSEPMLARARQRLRRAKPAGRLDLVRGDITALPFPAARFDLVMAPYGVLQSLLADAVVEATVSSVRRVLVPGGTFGVDLVPDLPSWPEYQKRLKLKGPRGRGSSMITLMESVRQDPANRLTIFDQEFTERRGTQARTHRFSLAFRTLSVEDVTRCLDRAGFRVTAVLGDYDNGPWDPRADVWLVLAAPAR
jgi:ubiquinone/menaquinone biosynthesis C-methylase UbiE